MDTSTDGLKARLISLFHNLQRSDFNEAISARAESDQLALILERSRLEQRINETYTSLHQVLLRQASSAASSIDRFNAVFELRELHDERMSYFHASGLQPPADIQHNRAAWDVELTRAQRELEENHGPLAVTVQEREVPPGACSICLEEYEEDMLQSVSISAARIAFVDRLKWLSAMSRLGQSDAVDVDFHLIGFVLCSMNKM